MDKIVKKTVKLMEDLFPEDLAGHRICKLVTKLKRLQVVIDDTTVIPPGTMVDIRGEELGNAALDPLAVGRQSIMEDVTLRYLSEDTEHAYEACKPMLPRFAMTNKLSAKAKSRALEQEHAATPDALERAFGPGFKNLLIELVKKYQAAAVQQSLEFVPLSNPGASTVTKKMLAKKVAEFRDRFPQQAALVHTNFEFGISANSTATANQVVARAREQQPSGASRRSAAWRVLEAKDFKTPMAHIAPSSPLPTGDHNIIGLTETDTNHSAMVKYMNFLYGPGALDAEDATFRVVHASADDQRKAKVFNVLGGSKGCVTHHETRTRFAEAARNMRRAAGMREQTRVRHLRACALSRREVMHMSKTFMEHDQLDELAERERRVKAGQERSSRWEGKPPLSVSTKKVQEYCVREQKAAIEKRVRHETVLKAANTLVDNHVQRTLMPQFPPRRGRGSGRGQAAGGRGSGGRRPAGRHTKGRGRQARNEGWQAH